MSDGSFLNVVAGSRLVVDLYGGQRDGGGILAAGA